MPVLTAAQMRFARERDARAGCTGTPPASVFFYREDANVTLRWLVGGRGDVLDVAYFTRGAS